MNIRVTHLTLLLALVLLCTTLLVGASARGDSPTQLRRFIGQQVGGLENLMVPAQNTDIPQPRLADGSPDPAFETTEAKRYLGKLLFYDPVRTVRIQPEFGGKPATRSTASCGSCHMPEAAGKSGTLFNFAVGAEGRGYTDAAGNFIPRRRPRPELPILRETPLYAGDTLQDAIPTLTDIYERAVGSPARGNKLPDPGELIGTGRLDALDSVSRNAPTIIGSAFNNRLLLGGFAGEPDEAPGGLNPFDFVAQESLTLLLLDAHRMLERQSAELQKYETYRKLFRDAFPEEAAQADAANDLNLLINDETVIRATATFLRTAVSRNTPWDLFLAGDDEALTPAQQRGAELFFTSAAAGGAGCYTCHSGPMLNKQVNDPGVAGAGEFVEENFYNLGVTDFPLQALNVVARNEPDFRDDGRREITGLDNDAFKFRVPTLRQVRDGKFYFHNGSIASVEGVVQYFNKGVPQDPSATAAGTLSARTLTPRFTNPRGPGSPPGLGLTDAQVKDITSFLEDGLYDPALVDFDPDSTTDTLGPNLRDLTYSVVRPDLAALGAVDGRMPSGLPHSNNDPLSRRDLGLEFLDVTTQLDTTLLDASSVGSSNLQKDEVEITNNSEAMVDTHLLIVVEGLAPEVALANASGVTRDDDPYLRVFLPDGVLPPTQSIVETLFFEGEPEAESVTYTLKFLSGQGAP